MLLLVNLALLRCDSFARGSQANRFLRSFRETLNQLTVQGLRYRGADFRWPAYGESTEISADWLGRRSSRLFRIRLDRSLRRIQRWGYHWNRCPTNREAGSAPCQT